MALVAFTLLVLWHSMRAACARLQSTTFGALLGNLPEYCQYRPLLRRSGASSARVSVLGGGRAEGPCRDLVSSSSHPFRALPTGVRPHLRRTPSMLLVWQPCSAFGTRLATWLRTALQRIQSLDVLPNPLLLANVHVGKF